MSNLKRSAIRAVAWSYIGTIVRTILQLFVQISLARILGPEPFGAVATALIFTSFLCLVVELGLGAALVQTADAGDDVIATIWFYTIAAGLAGTLGLAGLAMAWNGATPEVRFAMIALSPIIVMQGATIVPLAVLRRRLDMRAIQVAQIGGYFAGFLLVGVTMALFRPGVMPLIAAWDVCYAVTLLCAVGLARQWTWPWPRASIGFLRGFGLTVLVTNLLNWGMENLDRVAVGSSFGSRALGLYTASYNLVRAPTNQLVVALQGPMFAATAHAHREGKGLANAFLAALAAVFTVSACVFGTVAAFAPTVTLGLMGPKWVEAAGVLAPLSLAMIFHSAMAICGPVMAGAGHPQHEMRVQAITLISFGAAIALASFGTILILAWLVTAVYAMRAALMLAAVSRVLGFDLGQLTLIATRAAALTLVAVAASAAIQAILPNSLDASLRLVILIGTAFLVSAASLYFQPRFFLGAQLCGFIEQSAQGGRIPQKAWAPFARRLRG